MESSPPTFSSFTIGSNRMAHSKRPTIKTMKKVSNNSFTRGNISPVKVPAIHALVLGSVVMFVKRIETHITIKIMDKNGMKENPLEKRTNISLKSLVPAGVFFLDKIVSQSLDNILSSFTFFLYSASNSVVIAPGSQSPANTYLNASPQPNACGIYPHSDIFNRTL